MSIGTGAASNVYKTDRVEGGEDILIARDGLVVARLVAEKKPARKPGRLAGKIRIHKGFDDPLPSDVLAAFAGEIG